MSCTITAAYLAHMSPTSCAASSVSATFYGSNPQFICASATIGNPLELAERVLGVTRRASRRGRTNGRAAGGTDASRSR